MTRVLTFVDVPLLRQLATGIIGSEVKLTERDSNTYGINFKVLLSRSVGDERTRTTKISELLPELLSDAVYDAIQTRLDSLESQRPRFIAGTPGAFVPGTPLLVNNCVIVGDGKNAATQLSGEACVSYRLKVGDFFIHSYIGQDAQRDVDSLVDQPLEALGVLRYTTPYTVSGAYNLNLGLRIAALWLR